LRSPLRFASLIPQACASGGTSGARTDIIGKALGVERIVRQKVEPLALHLATVTAVEAPHLHSR
jgi:hypothetical protein